VFRIGFGYDVHRLVEGRPLILGGVKIAHGLGLEGHSDADVLIHAVIDAVIGALGVGDIGQHFPDTDPAYKGVSSLLLLKTTVDLMADRGYQLNNLDATVVAQAPKLAPYIKTMQKNIADLFTVPVERINIKATTSERLGFCGKQEGMEAFAVASLMKTSLTTNQRTQHGVRQEGEDK
jgi:2-C-methyl-D-erythritol 2,4-cyclodiphosphate synthase